MAGPCAACGSYARHKAETSLFARVLTVVDRGELVNIGDLQERTSIYRTGLYRVMEELVGLGFFEIVDLKEPDYPGWYHIASARAQRKWRVRNDVPRQNYKFWKRII